VIELTPIGTLSDSASSRELSEEALLQLLMQMDPASAFYQHAAALLDERLVRNRPSVLAPTPRGPRRLLSIGMATYDDYDGVYFAVQAIRLYHPEVTDCTEILVLDNHPSGPCAQPLKALEHHVAGYRYVPYERVHGNWVRDLLFREANAEFVLSMDSHVLFRPGALAQLVKYLEAEPGTADLLQGPLMGDNLKPLATHFDPVWRTGMYGVWATDPRGLDPGAPPFDIPMQGLGVFGCRRAVWPGYNPRLRGFGVEEGYLHEKIRRAGGRTLCLPFLGWIHRFARPFGPRYVVSIEDRMRNQLLVDDELGHDPGPAIAHFEQEYGADFVRPIVDRVEQELRGPFHFFDAIYSINLEHETDRWESVLRQCTALGIDHRIRRFAAIDTPTFPGVGRALSHRAVLAEASWQGLDNVLVLEDDVMFSRRIADSLAHSLAELRDREWRLLSLGGSGRDCAPTEASGERFLQTAQRSISLHAVAYHHTVYDRMLTELPATPTGMARWLQTHTGIGHYYAERFNGMSLMTCPSVATQPSLLPHEVASFEPLAVTS
jgi:hypothetical protein